jgi:hypothetical protein
MHCSMYMEEARKTRCGASCCALLLVLMVVGALRSSAPTCVGYLVPSTAATANDGVTQPGTLAYNTTTLRISI